MRACTAEAPVGSTESVFTDTVAEVVAVTGLAQVAFEIMVGDMIKRTVSI
jgi:hypothetical protein